MKSGYVSLIGRANVGKSTLLNACVGEKVAIVSRRPQTTRTRISGIRNLPGVQCVFLDTPGIHSGKKLLNRAMTEKALSALRETDVVVHMVEPTAQDEGPIQNELKRVRTPILLAINKVDTLKDKRLLLPVIGAFHETHLYREIVPVSALTGDGLDLLLSSIVSLLPEGEALFPEDMMTGETERFLAQEIVREKVFEYTHQEIPHSTAVAVEDFTVQQEKKLVSIRAAIYVEKPSQKGIVIGKGGAMLKRIGTQARKDIEALLGSRVFLELWVKVRREWTNDPGSLKEFGLL